MPFVLLSSNTLSNSIVGNSTPREETASITSDSERAMRAVPGFAVRTNNFAEIEKGAALTSLIHSEIFIQICAVSIFLSPRLSIAKKRELQKNLTLIKIPFGKAPLRF